MDDKENINIDSVVGIKQFELSSNGTVFIGLNLSCFEMIGGSLKIGFNIPF